MNANITLADSAVETVDVSAIPAESSVDPPNPTPPTDQPELSPYRQGIRELADIVVEIETATGIKWFKFGKRALELVKARRDSVKNYSAGDYERHCNDIEEDVRLIFPVSIDSIKVSERIKRYVLREECREILGKPLADKLSQAHYASFVSPVLVWDVKSLTGSIRTGWIDAIKDVATDLANGETYGFKALAESDQGNARTHFRQQ